MTDTAPRQTSADLPSAKVTHPAREMAAMFFSNINAIVGLVIFGRVSA